MAPDLGSLPTLLVVGSLIVIAATMLIVRLRGSRAPDSYQASRGEELVTVAMHPTDLVNVIKSYTGKLGRGTIWHLGEWKPQFDEHERISAGHFDANLNAESGIQINESPPSRPESKIGMILVTAGLLLTTAAGFLMFRATSADLGSAAAVTDALRTPLALVIFGALFYRVGIIPMSELEWNSVIVKCIVNGTYQEQGSVTHLHAGDSTVRGSVLTRATVQPRCAYLKSVGFLRPGLASHRVPRLIDRVERADQVGNELLAAIHAHAREMMTTGTTSEPMKLTLPHEPTDARGDGDDTPEPPQPNTRH